MILCELNPDVKCKTLFHEALKESYQVECDGFIYTYLSSSFEDDIVQLNSLSGSTEYTGIFIISELMERDDVIIIGFKPASNDKVYDVESTVDLLCDNFYEYCDDSWVAESCDSYHDDVCPQCEKPVTPFKSIEHTEEGAKTIHH
jgi:hypothetical protein